MHHFIEKDIECFVKLRFESPCSCYYFTLLFYRRILPRCTYFKESKKKNLPDKLQSFSFLKFSFYSNRIFCQFYQAHYFFGLAQTFSSTAFIYCCNKEKIIRHEAQQKLRISYAYLYHSIITSQITKK